MSGINDISMKVIYDKDSCCSQCGCTYPYTKEMYEIRLFHNTQRICYNCTNRLFYVTLHASIEYDGKLKTKEDVQRSERSSYHDSVTE